MKSDFIEIKPGVLSFEFEGYGNLAIQFNRTYKLTGSQVHSLPPSTGLFQVYHMESVLEAVTGLDAKRGGVVLPMQEQDATWLRFSPYGEFKYFAIQVAAGKINAVSGMPWQDALQPGEYMETPKQPWIDGFNQGNGVIRQFVSTALGQGNTVEEVATGEAKWGGLQIIVYPLNEQGIQKLKAIQQAQRNRIIRSGVGEEYAGMPLEAASLGNVRGMSASISMGMEQGAQIVQTFHTPTFGPEDYDTSRALRVFVTMKDADMMRKQLTRSPDPIEPKKIYPQPAKKQQHPTFTPPTKPVPVYDSTFGPVEPTQPKYWLEQATPVPSPINDPASLKLIC